MTTKTQVFPAIENIATLESYTELAAVVGTCSVIYSREEGKSISIRTRGRLGEIYTFTVGESGSLRQISGPPIEVNMNPSLRRFDSEP